MTYYAYVHARPETTSADDIFYVGKGNSIARSRNLSGRNPYHANVISKYGKDTILIGTIGCSSESAAFELEKGLIKCLRRMGVALTNMTDGGEGQTSAKAKEFMALPHVAAKHKEKVTASWKNPLRKTYQHKYSNEERKAQSARMIDALSDPIIRRKISDAGKISQNAPKLVEQHSKFCRDKAAYCKATGIPYNTCRVTRLELDVWLDKAT